MPHWFISAGYPVFLKINILLSIYIHSVKLEYFSHEPWL